MSPRARIAVIDDDPVLADLVRELLAEEGFEVGVCNRWDAAHAFVVGERPDLVVLDPHVGDPEDGWRVLDQLALDATTRRIPVILCSGAGESLRTRGPALLRAHGVFVLSKPFAIDALLEAVAQALGTSVRLGWAASG